MSNNEFAYAQLLQRLDAERNAALEQRRQLSELRAESNERDAFALPRLRRREQRRSHDSVEASQSASADCGVLD